MELIEKLKILTDSAKYDAACTSSGSDRKTPAGGIGNTSSLGCCHSFSADGRCISLLKVLMSNYCIYDCKYCINRKGNDIKRAAFTPSELAELTIEFYRRNYIEGLFLSSGVLKNPDYTMEQMIKTLELLRYKYNFWGYIHAKTIPGACPNLVDRLGRIADRLSVNIELPSEQSLIKLAPNKKKADILAPMQQIKDTALVNKADAMRYKNASGFVPAGQATQMIIGATPENDLQIIKLSSALYSKYNLKRIFYSAYIPTVSDSLLPSVDTKPPLLREHRLYQADWLMRMYKFTADEILNDSTPNFNPYLDPKSNWAINNIHYFPIDVNTASKDKLLRVPGIGPLGANKIIKARCTGRLSMQDLQRMGIVLKRAKYFVITRDYPTGIKAGKEVTTSALIDPRIYSFGTEQLSMFKAPLGPGSTFEGNISLDTAVKEAVLCLAGKL